MDQGKEKRRNVERAKKWQPGDSNCAEVENYPGQGWWYCKICPFSLESDDPKDEVGVSVAR